MSISERAPGRCGDIHERSWDDKQHYARPESEQEAGVLNEVFQNNACAVLGANEATIVGTASQPGSLASVRQVPKRWLNDGRLALLPAPRG